MLSFQINKEEFGGFAPSLKLQKKCIVVKVERDHRSHREKSSTSDALEPQNEKLVKLSMLSCQAEKCNHAFLMD